MFALSVKRDPSIAAPPVETLQILHLVLTGPKLLIFGSAQQHQLLTVALASLTKSEEEAGLWFHSSLSADGADFFFYGDWWSRSVNPTVQQTKAEEFLPEANCDTHMLTPQQHTHTQQCRESMNILYVFE